ncbi:MAG: hypothetical protein K0U93_05490, partial [Gammaproteobacteria bacterium]|nr:hypothetical protein [Gammaproteobacteria bacterium]
WLFVALGVLGIRATSRAPTKVIVAVTLGALAMLGGTTHARAQHWASLDALSQWLVAAHPHAPRAHGIRAQFLIEARRGASEVYAALGRYAQSDHSNVTALGEMIRIVSRRAIDAEGAVQSQNPSQRLTPTVEGEARQRVGLRPLGVASRHSDGALDLSADRLVASSAALHQLERELSNEIARRLSQFPMSAGNVQALLDMVGCIARQAPECRRLASDTRDWFAIAAANPRMHISTRALLAAGTGRMSILEGDWHSAATYAQAARDLEPANPQYWVEQFRVLLQMDRLQQAEILLKTLADQAGVYPALAAMVPALRSTLDATRQAAGS